MDYIFLGSGQFAATILPQLKPLPKLVVTQPDRLGGRGMKTLIPTPVKLAAEKLNLAQGHSLLEQGVTLSGFCLALVADYGEIIKKNFLEMPEHGFWNIHPSLLPKYRGPTPLQSTLLNNEKITGVSIIRLDELVDHGDILTQEKTAIDINDNYESLLEKTANLGAAMFNKLLASLPDVNPQAQNHAQATFTKKIKKEHGFIPLEQLVPYLEPIFKKYNLLHLLPKTSSQPINAEKLHNMIRAYAIWPNVWSQAGEKVIKMTKSVWQDNLVIQEVVINGKKYQ